MRQRKGLTSDAVRQRSGPLVGVFGLLLALCACTTLVADPSVMESGASVAATQAPMGATVAPVSGSMVPAEAASFINGPAGAALAKVGYEEHEYFASGTAFSYRATAPEGNDGKWQVTPDTMASYRTRFVVRMPIHASKFNGTVLVEWLNVSGGEDAAPDGTYLSPELERAGYAWVGVSAQKVGVDKLRSTDPARYSSLDHPGDQYSFDIFSQVALALRSTQGVRPLAALHPTRFVAVGESQSAIYLTSYIDAIQPLAHAFDGFLVHSRSGGAITFPGASASAGMLNGAIRIRSDVGVPVLVLATETDEAFGNYYHARQPDSRDFRLWDIAGASHADTYLGGAAMQLGCTSPNDAPSHFVIAASMFALERWLHTGSPPPAAPRMDVQMVNGAPVVQHDTLGLASGGIEGPWVSVPVSSYSGVAEPGSPGFCVLFGTAHPFTAAQLTSLYKTKADYLKAYAKATDQDIKAGYLLPQDRAAVLSFAQKIQF